MMMSTQTYYHQRKKGGDFKESEKLSMCEIAEQLAPPSKFYKWSFEMGVAQRLFSACKKNNSYSSRAPANAKRFRNFVCVRRVLPLCKGNGSSR
jgi:hypothetical protein